MCTGVAHLSHVGALGVAVADKAVKQTGNHLLLHIAQVAHDHQQTLVLEDHMSVM